MSNHWLNSLLRHVNCSRQYQVELLPVLNKFYASDPIMYASEQILVTILSNLNVNMSDMQRTVYLWEFQMSAPTHAVKFKGWFLASPNISVTHQCITDVTTCFTWNSRFQARFWTWPSTRRPPCRFWELRRHCSELWRRSTTRPNMDLYTTPQWWDRQTQRTRERYDVTIGQTGCCWVGSWY